MAHPGPLQRLTRLLRHRWADGRLRRVLTPEVLQRLGQRVAASERRHTGQIRICAEGGLPLSYLWRGASARERAITQFGKLRVWDTEHNDGVLIYVLLADRDVEIVADRGINAKVGDAEWTSVCRAMEKAFRAGNYAEGVEEGVRAVGDLLAAHSPRNGSERNEISDKPVIL